MNQIEQVTFFRENGYLLIENMFSISEIENLNSQIAILDKHLGAVSEENSKILRSLNGSHKHNKCLSEICGHQGLVSLAKKILSSDVYVHQFKINMKAAFHGDVWEWHQDHIFWLKEDGMLKPNAITVAIFLTEANEFNAPLMLIPRSHHLGTVDVFSPKQEDNWMSTVSAKLKYTLSEDLVREQVLKNGIISAKGKAGSVLFFHSNIFHSSTKNLSPFDRVMLMISYNSINNKLQKVENPRPDFLVEQSPFILNDIEIS